MNSLLRAAVRNLWLGRGDTLTETLTGYGVDEHRAAALVTWTRMNAKERGTKLSECLREANELLAFGPKNTELPFETLEEISNPKLSQFAIVLFNLANELFLSQARRTERAAFRIGVREIIRSQYPVAWAEGMMEVGLTPADMTARERQALQAATNAAVSAIPGLEQFIITHLRKDDLTRTYAATIAPRVNIWINGYGAVANRAAAMAGKDEKLEWRLGVAEHCTSCIRLNGKVKRASWWVNNGVLPAVPGADYLVCRGFNCKCSLNPTDKPLSRGRMPKLP
jgi:hypothetical protein